MSRGWEREDERGRLLEAWGWRSVRWSGGCGWPGEGDRG